MVRQGEETARWKQLSAKFMSDESSDEDNNTINIHKPVWRSKSKCVMPSPTDPTPPLSEFYTLCEFTWYAANFSFFLIGLNEFLKVLDERIEEKKRESKRYSAERIKRVDGSLLHSNPPENTPSWCVDKDWRNGM